MATAAAAKDEQTAHRFAKDQLKAFVERVERLEEEKKAISDDIRDVYAEAKGNGFDVKALRKVVCAAQAGCRRAQGAGGDSGDLPARAGDDLKKPARISVALAGKGTTLRSRVVEATDSPLRYRCRAMKISRCASVKYSFASIPAPLPPRSRGTSSVITGEEEPVSPSKADSPWDPTLAADVEDGTVPVPGARRWRLRSADGKSFLRSPARQRRGPSRRARSQPVLRVLAS